MLYNKQAVRDNIRNRDGKRVFYLAKGDQLTSDARDFLLRERIAIVSPEQAKPEAYQLPGGGFCTEKPEHMTHLDAQLLVPKTHPRIAFRGAVDLLEAELLLCQQNAPALEYTLLQEALDLARLLIRCDVMKEPVPEQKLDGMSAQQLRERSHFPQRYYLQPHFMPDGKDSLLLLQINRARCAARQAELAAVRAFSDRDGVITRPDMVQAMNRLSSFLYIIMIRLKAKQ